MARLHDIVGRHAGDGDGVSDDVTVVVGIETERGPWVQALVAAGYLVYPVNPLQVARYRERHRVSGAKSDPADAHVLADMVRTDHQQLRPMAGDSPQAEAIKVVKVVSRAHKTLIRERARHTMRLRQALPDFFPAALDAFEDLTATDTLALLTIAPDPASAAALGVQQVIEVLAQARHVHSDRLVDAVGLQAFCALTVSPGARAYYDRQRARGAGHRAALRQLANRLVGILHGCLKTGTCYDEATAWNHHQQETLAATT